MARVEYFLEQARTDLRKDSYHITLQIAEKKITDCSGGSI